jgi:predicted nucleic acid-binding protein
MRMGSSWALIVDSGFWIAMFDPRDQYHHDALTLPVDLDTLTVLVPWPSLYETVSTRFVRDRRRLAPLLAALKSPNVLLLDDHPYRDDAYAGMESAATARPLSLVDRVIRLMLADSSLRVKALLTFNRADFADVCRSHSIELLPT